jgi:hypothetical protein
MRSIEYYCSVYFDPRDGQELSAPQFLLRKIYAGKDTIDDLLEVDFMERDQVRIKKISDAISDWRKQFNEIYGIETEIE